MKPFYLLGLLVLVLLSNAPKAMEISSRGSGETLSIVLVGKIEDGDFKKFVQTIRNNGAFPKRVIIRSPGGDVEEAIRIGRFIRESLLPVWAIIECNSACVLIWIGGVDRGGSATFGLHRPVYQKHYFAGLSASDAEKKYRELDDFVRTYLIDMNTPTAVIDKMMSTKSSDVALVTSESLIEIVGERSPAYQEWIIAKCGEFSSSEKYDDAAVIKLLFFDDAKKRLGTEEETSMDSYILKNSEAEAKYARSLSPGYREYLEKKRVEILICEKKSVESVRKELLSKY